MSLVRLTSISKNYMGEIIHKKPVNHCSSPKGMPMAERPGRVDGSRFNVNGISQALIFLIEINGEDPH